MTGPARRVIIPETAREELMRRFCTLALVSAVVSLGWTGTAWAAGQPACPVAECAPEPGGSAALSARAETESRLTAAFSSSRGVKTAVSAASPVIEPVAVRPAQEEWLAHRQRKWMMLTAVQHGAAAFDAWSTRRAVRAGAHELNPLLRPVADSHALHGVIHVTPLLTDYVSRRMATSEKRWLRRLWWVPQAASTAVHVSAGINNLGSYRQATR